MPQTKRVINKNSKFVFLDTILLFVLSITFIFILKELYDIEEVIREWINKPMYNYHVGYYKCGGTRKHPEFCPITLKEKINENN